ncbi:hypothetical protein N798_03015 [Knoellia flava TL1]|uniref:Uncharacterized protein n=1 Tax=Knoellia flava TL1 TaxID=1385518 RepID=A0ABR4XHZ8_9MICO|nr:hypothetical protein N798_03015 [Knoellia flava TL1]
MGRHRSDDGLAAVGGTLSVLWLLGSPIPGTRTIEEFDDRFPDPAPQSV